MHTYAPSHTVLERQGQVARPPGPLELKEFLYLILCPLGGTDGGPLTLDVDAVAQGLSEVVKPAKLRTTAHVADGGQDVTVRLLVPMATSTTSEALRDAVRILHLSRIPAASPEGPAAKIHQPWG